MPEPQILHDDYGDAIAIEADALTAADADHRLHSPAVLVTFYDSGHELSDDARDFTRMRLSGERLAAFTEAIDRHAGYLAALASGSDDA